MNNGYAVGSDIEFNYTKNGITTRRMGVVVPPAKGQEKSPVVFVQTLVDDHPKSFLVKQMSDVKVFEMA